jgi:type IV secretory pathway TrbD component
VDDKSVPGWESTVHHALTKMPTMGGVPLTVFVGLFVGTLYLFLLWPQGAVFGGILYGLAVIGTRVEPCWYGIALEWVQYRGRYEA